MANEIRLRRNNISGAINDNPLLIGATTINSPSFAELPVVDATNHLILVLDPLEVYGAAEAVRVTDHTASATLVTVVRGQEGSVARQHPLGTTWFHGPVTSDWTEIVTSGTRPAVPYYGQTIFETDTNKFVARSTTDAWQEVVDLGVWDNWTPQLFQSVSVTMNITRATFTRIGRTIHLNCSLAITGAGTSGQEIQIRNLPIAAAASHIGVGTFRYFDSGNTILSGAATINIAASTTLNFYVSGNGNAMGVNPTFATANGDSIQVTITYEAIS